MTSATTSTSLTTTMTPLSQLQQQETFSPLGDSMVDAAATTTTTNRNTSTRNFLPHVVFFLLGGAGSGSWVPNLHLLPSLVLLRNSNNEKPTHKMPKSFHFHTNQQCHVTASTELGPFLDLLTIYGNGMAWFYGSQNGGMVENQNDVDTKHKTFSSSTVRKWNRKRIVRYFWREVMENKHHFSIGAGGDTNSGRGIPERSPNSSLHTGSRKHHSTAAHLSFTEFDILLHSCIELRIPAWRGTLYRISWNIRGICDCEEMNYRAWLDAECAGDGSQVKGNATSPKKLSRKRPRSAARKRPRNHRLLPPSTQDADRNEFTQCSDIQIQQELEDFVEDIIEAYLRETGDQISNIECYFVYSKLKEAYLLSIKNIGFVRHSSQKSPKTPYTEAKEELAQKPHLQPSSESSHDDPSQQQQQNSPAPVQNDQESPPQPSDDTHSLHNLEENYFDESEFDEGEFVPLLEYESLAHRESSPSRRRNRYQRNSDASSTVEQFNYSMKRESIWNFLPGEKRHLVSSPQNRREKDYFRTSNESMLESLRKSSLPPVSQQPQKESSPKKVRPPSRESTRGHSAHKRKRSRSAGSAPSTTRRLSSGTSTSGGIVDRNGIVRRDSSPVSAYESTSRLLQEIRSKIDDEYSKTDLASRIKTTLHSNGPAENASYLKRASSPGPGSRPQSHKRSQRSTSQKRERISPVKRRQQRRQSESPVPSNRAHSSTVQQSRKSKQSVSPSKRRSTRPKHNLKFDISLNNNGTGKQTTPSRRIYSAGSTRHASKRRNTTADAPPLPQTRHASAQNTSQHYPRRGTTPDNKLLQSPAAIRLTREKRLQKEQRNLQSKPDWSLRKRMESTKSIYANASFSKRNKRRGSRKMAGGSTQAAASNSQGSTRQQIHITLPSQESGFVSLPSQTQTPTQHKNTNEQVPSKRQVSNHMRYLNSLMSSVE